MGYKVSDDILQYAKQQNDLNLQILSATFLFCNANYMQAKYLFEVILKQMNHRSLKVMYAISLNRCREHKCAEKELITLIESSKNIDETTILVSFLISNHVHNRKINEAQATYEKYSEKLKTSQKYPYFLRNAATVFCAETAYMLRNTALEYFDSLNDYFGYYSTIINMTSYLIKNKPIEYAISTIQKAFDNLQQYNASQLHLAANNLGVCYLYAGDEWNTLKYLTLSFEKAQTVFPKGYAAINLSYFFLQKKQLDKAHAYLQILDDEVRACKLARLKAHFYLQHAVVGYISGNLSQTKAAITNAKKYCSSTENKKIYLILNKIDNNMKENILYNDNMFSYLFVPCFLEYWTINSIDVLSDDFLPR